MTGISELKWWIYLIRCPDGSLYTGIALDVDKRFAEHLEGSTKSAKFLRGKSPLELVLKQKIGTRSQALKLEIYIKKQKKEVKEKMLIDPLFLKKIIKAVVL